MPEFRNNDPFHEIKEDIHNHSKDHTMEFDSEDIKTNAVVAAVSYIPPLFFLPLVLRPDSRFARFHANQGLVLLILDVVLEVVPKIVDAIPFTAFIPALLVGGFSLIKFAYFLYGFIYTLNGKAKELPFLGGVRLIK